MLVTFNFVDSLDGVAEYSAFVTLLFLKARIRSRVHEYLHIILYSHSQNWCEYFVNVRKI